MLRWLPAALAMAALSFASGALGVFTAADLVVGDRTPPKLRAWEFMDLTGNPPLYSSKTVRGDDRNGAAFYTLVPPGESGPAAPLGSAIRQEGSGGAVGATLYAENEGEGGAVWGLNSIASTYNGNPAVGMEVNGINRSGHYGLVRGVDIVNAGNAPTEYALGITTSASQPKGKPRYGIMLAGPRSGYTGVAPASRTGILIEHIDSGEALQIAAGDFITLDGAKGRIRMRYNPQKERIEFFNGQRLAHTIPM